MRAPPNSQIPWWKYESCKRRISWKLRQKKCRRFLPDFWRILQHMVSPWFNRSKRRLACKLTDKRKSRFKTQGKSRQRSGFVRFSQPFLKNLVYHRAKSLAGMFRYFFYSISAILFHSAEDATQWFLLNITAVAKLEFWPLNKFVSTNTHTKALFVLLFLQFLSFPESSLLFFYFAYQ